MNMINTEGIYRISSNSFRGIYSFQVLPAAATKRGRLLLSSVKGKIIEWVIVVKEIPISTRNSGLHRLGTGRSGKGTVVRKLIEGGH